MHMIGVGGIGMSALARLFLHEGKSVSGSDRARSDITDALEKEGLDFSSNQTTENTSSRPCLELVVYTEAMVENHPEMVAARALGVPMMSYFEALGMVANEYYVIAVAGTHGKTTTTAMLIDVLEEAGLDPSAIVGSLRSKTKTNYRAGKSKYFVVEACEYKRNFLFVEPDVLVITNVEAEHLDYYKNLADVQSAFKELANKVPEDGVVVAQTADTNIVPILDGLKCQVIDYKKYLDLSLALIQPGIHNRLNASAGLAVADYLGIESVVAKNALENFTGTWRRFEYKGELNGAPVYDDYAHHPTEIMVTIAGVREKFPDKKITVVFQPHTYTRTNALFGDFILALAKADQVLMIPIYAAREENISGMTSIKIIESLVERGVKALHFETQKEVIEFLKSNTTDNDVLLIMGAGDVTKVASELTR